MMQPFLDYSPHILYQNDNNNCSVLCFYKMILKVSIREMLLIVVDACFGILFSSDYNLILTFHGSMPRSSFKLIEFDPFK